MSEANRLAISDAFSRQTYHFGSFLDRLQLDWPQESATIAEELDHYVRNISHLLRQYKEGNAIPTLPESVYSMQGQPVSLPTLPPSPIVAQGNELPCDFSLTHLAPIGTFLSPRSSDRASQSLTNRPFRESTLLNSGDEAMSLGLPPQNDVCEDMPGSTSNIDDGPQDIMLFANGTTHPAQHYADGTWGLAAFGNGFAPCNPEPASSLRSTILPRSAERGTTVAYNEIAPLPVMSPQQGAIGKRKRLPLHSRPQSRKRKCQTPNNFLHGNSELQHEIIRSLEKKDLDQVQTIHNMYLATASPDAMIQLEDMTRETYRCDEWRPSDESPSLVNTVRVLDKLDRFQQSATFLRRILLLRLAYHRQTLIQNLQQSRRSSLNSVQTPVWGKPASIVLDTLISQCYPDITGPLKEGDIHEWRETHSARRKALLNRLSAARNWLQAVEQFNFGIIALIPTGGVFQIQNQSFENLHETSCQVLLRLLKKKDDGHVIRAAAHLTSFVQEIYDGRRGWPTPGVNFFGRLCSERIDPSRALQLGNGLVNDE